MKPNSSNQSGEESFSKINLISWIEKDLIAVPGLTHDHINSLCRKLYPVEVSQNSYVALYKTMLQYFTIQISKGQTYESVSAEIVRLASPVNQSLSNTIAAFLTKDIIKDKFHHLFAKNNVTHQAQKKTASSSYGILQTLQLKYTGDNKASRDVLKKGFESYNKPSPLTSGQIAEKYMKERNFVQNLTQNKKNSLTCLVCQKQFFQNQVQFRCEDCGLGFHKRCQARKNNCSFCQLKNMNPLRKVKKQLFFGFLRKGVKKHDIQFTINEEDIISKSSNKNNNQNGPNYMKKVLPNIQIRSLRLKDYYDQVCNYINLFPDAATIMINSKLIKEFVPLHRQSSLKYRRDDAVKISNNLTYGQNKITITERFLKKDIKYDERVDIQNHLVGVYVVEDLSLPKKPNNIQQFLMRNPISSKTLNFQGISSNDAEFMKQTEVMSFGESEKMLQNSLLLNNQQQISCETLKSPLICSLTLGRMENPGRTIFCKHFSCFDIKNFFLVNSKAQLPRWQCPICKVPAYKFKIDCILNQILQMFCQSGKRQKVKQEDEPWEVTFQKDYSFKITTKDGKVLNPVRHKQFVNSIYDLPIEDIFKRFRQQSDEKERIEQNGENPRKIVHENNNNLEHKKSQIQEQKETIPSACKTNLQIEETRKQELAQYKIQTKVLQKLKVLQNKMDDNQTNKMDTNVRKLKQQNGQSKEISGKNNHNKHAEESRSNKGIKDFILPVGCQVVDLSD